MTNKEYRIPAELIVGFDPYDGMYDRPANLVVDDTPQGRQLTRAWYCANELAQSLDANARVSLLWLYIDPECPAWRRERILAVQSWWSSLWAHYGSVKQQILNGDAASFDPAVPGPCPWTIWQISGESP